MQSILSLPCSLISLLLSFWSFSICLKYYSQVSKANFVLDQNTVTWAPLRRLGKKTESARSSINKWTKTLYQDYLYCIANFCRALLNIFSKQFISSNTKRRKRMLNFVWNTSKFWWGNETDDEILPVFPQNHWTLKFIFSRSRGKLFFVSHRPTDPSFWKSKKKNSESLVKKQVL